VPPLQHTWIILGKHASLCNASLSVSASMSCVLRVKGLGSIGVDALRLVSCVSACLCACVCVPLFLAPALSWSRSLSLHVCVGRHKMEAPLQKGARDEGDACAVPAPRLPAHRLRYLRALHRRGPIRFVLSDTSP